MTGEQIRFIASGDMFITRRLPREGYEGFDELQALIGRHDVRFSNLEMTFHNKEGYPAAVSGGTWAMMEPEALDDVLRFGFNLFTTANNHSGDYGQEGILANIRHLREREMVFSGTGRNLSEAAKACYLETTKGRIALISVCSSFHESARAGGQSGEMQGRPGLSPLRFFTRFHLDAEHFRRAAELAALIGVNNAKEYSIRCGYSNPFPDGEMPFGSEGTFLRDDSCWTETLPNEKDVQRTVKEIREAKKQADVVLVTFHAHEFRGTKTEEAAMFLETFSRTCIDEGADAVIGHGPHELRGIEIYKGCPILYSLGNFLFETDTVSLQPYDAFDNKSLPADTPVGTYMDLRSKNGTVGYEVMENIWRSCLISWTMEEGKVKELQLYPISLGMGKKRSQRGIPRLSGDEAVLRYMQTLSEPYGTKIRIEDGIGKIDLQIERTEGNHV